jgi:hypothetical protein
VIHKKNELFIIFTVVKKELIMENLLQNNYQNSFNKEDQKVSFTIRLRKDSDLAVNLNKISLYLNSRPYGRPIEVKDVLEFLIVKRFSDPSQYGDLISSTLTNDDKNCIKKDRFNAKEGTDLSKLEFTNHAIDTLMAQTFGHPVKH